MNQPQNEPMNLEALKKVNLGLHVFIVRPGADRAQVPPQDVRLIVTYTEEDALETLQKQCNPPFSFDYKGKINMKDVMKLIKESVASEPSATPSTPSPHTPLLPPPLEISQGKGKKEFFLELIQEMKNVAPKVLSLTEQKMLPKMLKKFMVLVGE